MSDDLAARVRAELDEREALAKAATPGPWWNESRILHAPYPPGGKGAACHPATCGYGSGTIDDPDANAEHIAANDPSSVLRQVEGLRQIVERHKPVGAYVETNGPLCDYCSNAYSHRWPCLDVQSVAFMLGVSNA